MTLTTEQLKTRIEALRNSASGIVSTFSADADALEELLRYREAQPVACDIERIKRHAFPAGECPRQSRVVLLSSLQRLLTAPPAPAKAVAWQMRYWNSGYNMWHDWERITAEQHAEMSVQHAADNDYELRVLYDAPPAPAVQDGWIACSERMPELDKRVLLYFGSYDGHIEDGCIGDDGDGPYHYFFDGDSLQQDPTHWMPLPAAPEGGN